MKKRRRRSGGRKQRGSARRPLVKDRPPNGGASAAAEPRRPPAERSRLGARPWAAAGLALAALIALGYGRVLFGNETLVERDALRFTLPSREFLAQALRAGRLPEWSDAVGLGAPFAANPVHEALAPLGWTMALLPTPLGFDLYNVLHVLIGGLGAAALSRRLGAGAAGSVVAGGALALGGYVTSMVPSGLAPALAWTPWVAWAAHRFAARLSETPRERRACWRAGAIFAATFALQLMAGEPASILIAAAVAWIVVLAHAARPLPASGMLLIAGSGASLLAAHAIVPGLYLLSASARGAGLDQGGLEWSLHPARLLELVWPMAFGSQRGDGWYAGLLLRDGPGDPFWSYSLFLGAPILLALGLAWREPKIRRWILAGLPFLLVAAGPLTPLYALLLRLLPPLRLVNFPEKFVYGALLLWAAAAGVGWSRMMGAGTARRVRWLALTAAAALAVGVSALGVWRQPLVETLAARAEEWQVLIRADAGVAMAMRGGGIAAAGAGLFALALALHGRAPRQAWVLALLATLGPLVWAAGSTTSFAPRSIVADTPAVLRPAAPFRTTPEDPRPRLFRLPPLRPSGPFARGEEIARDTHESLETNVASRFGLSVLSGFEPGESERMRRFGREILPQMSDLSFVRLLGVDWIAMQDPEKLRSPFPEVSRGHDGWALLATGAVRPRAFVAPRWRAAADPDQALETLTIAGRENDPATIVVVDPDPGKSPAAGPLSPCGVLMPRPEEVRLDCDSPDGGYAVLLGEQAPGWSATVDGRSADVRLADGLFRAVAVGPGRHEIVFRYRTPGLRAGAAASLASWLAWVALMISARRRGR